MTDITDNNLPATQADDDYQQVVMQRETQMVTHRAMLLEAQARELEAAYGIAKRMSKTKMVREEYQLKPPRGDDEVDMTPVYNLAVAIQFGGNLGMTPEQAGIRVFTVHGIPSVESKDMIGAVRNWIDRRRQNGLTGMPLDGGDDVWEVSADETSVIWQARRDGREVSSEWTIARATQAGYVAASRGRNASANTKGMYDKVPIEMLRAKCQAEVCRILFSDVLRGVQYSREELQLEERIVEKPVPTKVVAERGADALEQMITSRAGMTGQGSATIVDAETDDAPVAGTYTTTDGETFNHEGEQAEPEPDDDSEQRLASAEELTPMHTLLTEAKVTDRAEKLIVISTVLGRDVTSSKQLTPAEVKQVVAALKGWGNDVRRACLDRIDEPDPRASMAQLTELRKAYREAGVSAKDLLGKLTDVLGWQVTNVNDLSEADVREAIRKVADEQRS